MFTNRLIHETSPYLLQHAHNPVNWYPWGSEALDLAKKENKPILVSIGYSACHWCHVMERESFENEETARIMNDHFINIKIDREERPDLDHIYMDAVQAMTGSGGWPLNVFLTPEGKPFYGGTYFPPKKVYNRPSWQEVLLAVSQAFKERRNEIDAQADNLSEHLLQANAFGVKVPVQDNFFSASKSKDVCTNLLKTADKEWGGFGNAPKFPQTFAIKFLLRHYHETGNAEALNHALLSVDKMIQGGIYDHAGGGFARYATDSEWLVPHFEKMLYDNALLLVVISEVYQLTGEKKYREVIEHTIDFVCREMMDEEGGFYSALDADSEGEEGKFYVWKYEEVQELLGPDAELFCRYFDISPLGNWAEGTSAEKGKNILWIKESTKKFCERNNIDEEKLTALVNKGKNKLFEARKQRIRPSLDDKILLGWNALMTTALCKAFAATGILQYRELAQKNTDFLLRTFTKNNSREFWHTYKKGIAKYPAFLDDYAFLIEALMALQDVTGDTAYLTKAQKLTEQVIDHFSEETTGFFFYTSKGQEDIILRKKEVYDGAVPSGNAVMADNLYRLSLYFNIPEWRERSVRMITSLGNAITRYPLSFGYWACLYQEITFGTNEIAIVGKSSKKLLEAVLQTYTPHKIVMCSEMANNQFPLLTDKTSGNGPLIYLCRNYSCEKPVANVLDLMALLGKKNS